MYLLSVHAASQEQTGAEGAHQRADLPALTMDPDHQRHHGGQRGPRRGHKGSRARALHLRPGGFSLTCPRVGVTPGDLHPGLGGFVQSSPRRLSDVDPQIHTIEPHSRDPSMVLQPKEPHPSQHLEVL